MGYDLQTGTRCPEARGGFALLFSPPQAKMRPSLLPPQKGEDIKGGCKPKATSHVTSVLGAKMTSQRILRRVEAPALCSWNTTRLFLT